VIGSEGNALGAARAAVARSRRRSISLGRGAAVATSLLLVAGAVLTAAPAGAALTHPFQAIDGVGGGELVSSNAVAVDNSGGPNGGDLYVNDAGGARLRKYDPSGTPKNFSALGVPYISPLGINGDVNQIAVDNFGANKGNIYVVGGGGTVLAFKENGEPAPFTASAGYISENALTGSPGGAFGQACGVAIDPYGYIYVGDNAGRILIYAPSGEYLTQFNFQNVTEIAVDSEGVVYAQAYAGKLTRFAPSIYPVTAQTEYGSEHEVFEDSNFGLGIDPTNDDVYINRGSRITQLTSAAKGNTVISNFGVSHMPNESNSMAIDRSGGATDGDVYVSEGNSLHFLGGSEVLRYGPMAAVPTPASGEPEAITRTTATLRGTVNPEGIPLTSCFLEYGPASTPKPTNTVPCEAPDAAEIGSGLESTRVHADISGLTVATKYRFRLASGNANGTEWAPGTDHIFETVRAVANLTTDFPSGGTDESTHLNGSFDLDSLDTHYYFEWGTTSSYGTSVPAIPKDAGTGTGRLAVEPAEITGLEKGATYHYRIVAFNELGTTYGQDREFTTVGPPAITNFTYGNLGAESVDLKATISPEQAETEYRFEYGITTGYGSSIPIPDADIGDGGGAVTVTQHLNVQPRTTYHFRVVAHNQYGTVNSEDQSFGFYPPECPNAQVRGETRSTNLPDCRAYEIVSPGYAEGVTLVPGAGPVTGFATNPSKLAYGAIFGIIPNTGEPPNNIGDVYAATRTPNGWKSKYIGLSGDKAREVGGPPEYSPACFYSLSPTKVSSLVAADPSMSRFVNYDFGDSCDQLTTGPWSTPQFGSNVPYIWNTDNNQLLERWPTNFEKIPGGSKYVGYPITSGDLNHFVFSSNVVFAPGGEAQEPEWLCYECYNEAGTGVISTDASVYDYNTETGETVLASVLGDENETPFKARPVAVSSDGSRILMRHNQQLFVRSEDTHTYEIAPGHQVTYLGTAEEGREVFITSAEQLTPDDKDNSVDLFVWDEAEPNTLTRLSTGDQGEAGNADNCSVPWIPNCDVRVISFAGFATAPGGLGGNGRTDSYIASETGEIYFESAEQLDGSRGKAGMVNLYVYRDGAPQFVTAMTDLRVTLSGPLGTEVISDNPVARMQVTPDGAHVAFETASRVTAYDSAGLGEMYSYEPTSGKIVCVSCRPDGDPPRSDVLGSQNGLFMSYDGRVFFATADDLVPQDTNDRIDTYEFVEGRPRLISTGTGPAPTGFTGFNGFLNSPGVVSVSANGADVYFTTYDRLVSQDLNGNTAKIYDARANGGFPAENPVAPCAAADECHAEGSLPPAAVVNGSEADFGAGSNVKRPKKHKKHGKHRKKASAKKHDAKRDHGRKQAHANG
jgi:hypothetical protein